MEKRGDRKRAAGDAPPDKLLLLVDGDCAMCRGITRFAAKRDRRDRLRFAALDSPIGRERVSRLGLSLPPAGSFVLICGAAAWTRSEAAMRTLAALDPPWPAVAAALRLVPAKLRDAAYDAVAARRHRLAGLTRASQCPAVPDERVRRRLLDAAGWHEQEAGVEGDVHRGEERTW
ncbi:thiol-disulfide oxidoreductase DCC family protein [Cohnella sp. 56]|uniref:thiol-disulfide oxidoreductase DCC family protein n=1 Tax=Cohnella sp. 56 TaxID=3113722 RepID=UPI0030EA5699